MGTRKRLTREAVRLGLLRPFDLRATVPCRNCGVRIPVKALRNGHGLMEWCGTMRMPDSLGGGYSCPACAPGQGARPVGIAAKCT